MKINDITLVEAPAKGDYIDFELSESEMVSTWIRAVKEDKILIYADEALFNTLVNEAEYQGRDVPLGKPMQGDVKKFKVYVKNPKGNVVKGQLW